MRTNLKRMKYSSQFRSTVIKKRQIGGKLVIMTSTNRAIENISTIEKYQQKKLSQTKAILVIQQIGGEGEKKIEFEKKIYVEIYLEKY